MDRIYDYRRLYSRNRTRDKYIDLGNAGSFMEVPARPCTPHEECPIDGTPFSSIHKISQRNGKRIFTAYTNSEGPGTLLIVWDGYPFYADIEEGGDFMLQVLAADKTIRHLIIDNTYVRSGWMEDRMNDYLNNGWFPGLVELELRTFCHLQAESYLGKLSFDRFAEGVSDSINIVAQRLGKAPFKYYPVKTSEISPDGQIDDIVRDMALKKAYDIVKSL